MRSRLRNAWWGFRGMAVVYLDREQLNSLANEASGQSTLAHVELDEDRETYWAEIAIELRQAARERGDEPLLEGIPPRVALIAFGGWLVLWFVFNFVSGFCFAVACVSFFIYARARGARERSERGEG